MRSGAALMRRVNAHDPAAIANGLLAQKRAGVPFDRAWAIVVGQVPARQHGNGDGESVERATYRFMRAAYLEVGPVAQISAALERDAA